MECLSCGRREPRETAQEAWEDGTEVPICDCGGWLKPATISFGQQLVMEDLQTAFDEAAKADLFVAAGTSLVVSPINHMFELARQGDAGTAILTSGETPYDGLADWKIEQSLETVLPELERQIRAA